MIDVFASVLWHRKRIFERRSAIISREKGEKYSSSLTEKLSIRWLHNDEEKSFVPQRKQPLKYGNWKVFSDVDVRENSECVFLCIGVTRRRVRVVRQSFLIYSGAKFDQVMQTKPDKNSEKIKFVFNTLQDLYPIKSISITRWTSLIDIFFSFENFRRKNGQI